MQNVITYPFLLATLRNRRLRQYDLARLLKCSEVTVSRKLRGLQALTGAEKEIIAHALCVNVIWLFNEVLVPQPQVENMLADMSHVEHR